MSFSRSTLSATCSNIFEDISLNGANATHSNNPHIQFLSFGISPIQQLQPLVSTHNQLLYASYHCIILIRSTKPTDCSICDFGLYFHLYLACHYLLAVVSLSIEYSPLKRNIWSRPFLLKLLNFERHSSGVFVLGYMRPHCRLVVAHRQESYIEYVRLP